MGVEFVKALQGDDPRYLKVVATAKHYAVHSGPEPDRHHFDARPTERDLHETYLPAFRALVEQAKVASVMGAYNRVNGESASASRRLLLDILRREWGFGGYVVSDCGAIDDIQRGHEIVATPEEAAALAVKNGCDLECGTLYRSLSAALARGLLAESDVDVAVRRLMLARMRLGMFDPPERVPYAQIPYSVNDSPDHDRLARRMAQESIVPLKNDGVLPLSRSLKTIAVVGPNADDVMALLGNYYGTPSKPVTALAGIRQAVSPDTRVIHARGANLVEGRQDPRAAPVIDAAYLRPAPGQTGHGLMGEYFRGRELQYPVTLEYFEAIREAEVRLAWRLPGAKDPFEEALEAARSADAVVFVGGLTGDVEGEEMAVPYPGFAGGDRTDIALPSSQQKLLRALHATGKPVVLVLMTGSALAVEWAERNLPAILVAWYPGQEGGAAIADVLFGDVSPSGCLPVTFYRSVEQLPPFDDYDMKGRTYRYFAGEPLYPFGHGLSYTRFEYSGLRLDRQAAGPRDVISASLNIRNAGGRAGGEVVQLYVRTVEPKIPMPLKQLRGFERIQLAPGEQRRVTFRLVPAEDFSHYSEARQAFEVEPGTYEIQAGASSRDVRLTARVSVR